MEQECSRSTDGQMNPLELDNWEATVMEQECSRSTDGQMNPLELDNREATVMDRSTAHQLMNSWGPFKELK